jgi:hypothetical protein
MSEQKDKATVPSVDDVVLLPCPFCGGKAGYVMEDSYGSCHIGCNDEDCLGYARAFEAWQFGQRIDQWNTRRVLGLVNWIEAEYAKSGTASYLNQRCQALKECRKMVRRLLGQ